MSKVRIVFRDGKLRVLDEESGTPIEGVRNVTLYLSENGVSEALLFIPNPSVSVVADRSNYGVKHEHEMAATESCRGINNHGEAHDRQQGCVTYECKVAE